jgi:hypothetical protein
VCGTQALQKKSFLHHRFLAAIANKDAALECRTQYLKATHDKVDVKWMRTFILVSLVTLGTLTGWPWSNGQPPFLTNWFDRS